MEISTVQLLRSHRAHIKLCNNLGKKSPPPYTAYINGHESTVHLLLSHVADVNLHKNVEYCHLYKSCLNGHDISVSLLNFNGTDVNFCKKKNWRKSALGSLYK